MRHYQKESRKLDKPRRTIIFRRGQAKDIDQMWSRWN